MQDVQPIQGQAGQQFEIATLKSQKQSNVGLVGDSRKLTAVFYVTPFVAAVAFLFGYFKLDMEYAKLFFDWAAIFGGGYMGGQTLIDSVGKFADLLSDRFAAKTQSTTEGSNQ